MAREDKDEAIRIQYQSCPECGADLGHYSEILVQCPLCGYRLT